MWLDDIREIETEFEKEVWGKKCKYKRKKLITHLKCDNCGSEFQRDLNYIAPKRRNNNVKHFCSHCDSFVLAGKLASKVREEKYNKLIGKTNKYKGGYNEVYVKGTHKFRPEADWVREHILVMENHIGRKLKPTEVVHHIDGNKSNNDISNLDVCTIEQHNNCHAKSELIVFEMYKKGIVGYDSKAKMYFIK